MNAEYKRLESDARAIDRQIQELTETGVFTAAEHSQFERTLSELYIRLRSLRHAMLLIRSVDSDKMRKAERKFVAALPHKFRSQGARSKTVELPGGIRVTLHITYYHRSTDPANVRRKSRRGLYPALMLLGISDGFTPAVRSRMAQSAALLGSFEEAAEMLAGEGLDVPVNRLRKVTAGMGRMLSRLTSQGMLKAAGNAAGRRIVVTTDGGRVRLRERRRGKTKKGRKRFAAKWREPRLFMIYAVDDEGRLADDFPPIIDGTLGSCDELFAMMLAYLLGLSITKAERVLFVADGASWIWRARARSAEITGARGRRSPAVDRFLARGGVPRQTRGQQIALGREEKTLADDSEKAAAARRDRFGGGRTSIAAWQSPDEGPADVAELFHQARSNTSADGLFARADASHADRQRCNRECGSTRDQSAREKQWNLLAARKRRNHDSHPSMAQSRPGRRTIPANNLRHTTTRSVTPTIRESARCNGECCGRKLRQLYH